MCSLHPWPFLIPGLGFLPGRRVSQSDMAQDMDTSDDTSPSDDIACLGEIGGSGSEEEDDLASLARGAGDRIDSCATPLLQPKHFLCIYN